MKTEELTKNVPEKNANPKTQVWLVGNGPLSRSDRRKYSQILFTYIRRGRYDLIRNIEEDKLDFSVKDREGRSVMQAFLQTALIPKGVEPTSILTGEELDFYLFLDKKTKKTETKNIEEEQVDFLFVPPLNPSVFEIKNNPSQVFKLPAVIQRGSDFFQARIGSFIRGNRKELKK